MQQTPNELLALVWDKKKSCFIFQSHVCAQEGQAYALIIHFLNKAISLFGPGLHHCALICPLVAISRPCFCAVVQRFCPLMDIQIVLFFLQTECRLTLTQHSILISVNLVCYLFIWYE